MSYSNVLGNCMEWELPCQRDFGFGLDATVTDQKKNYFLFKILLV